MWGVVIARLDRESSWLFCVYGGVITSSMIIIRLEIQMSALRVRA